MTVKGSPAPFLPWEAGAPDDASPGEDCVEAVSSSSQLNDRGCSTSQAAVCEFDAAPGGLVCNNDSAFEPNGTIQSAVQSPVATSQTSVNYPSLAICPQGDADFFEDRHHRCHAEPRDPRLVRPGRSGASVDSQRGRCGDSRNAVPNGASALRAYTPNLPVGTYYAHVDAATGQNNYQLTINVTGP